MRTHRIYGSLQRGPLLGGIPVIQAFALGIGLGVGVFLAKGLFGLWVAGVWLAAGGAVWGALACLQAQDPCRLAVARMRLQAPWHREVNCFQPGRRTVRVRRER